MFRRLWRIAALLLPALPSSAQTFQFLPEVDTYYKVNPKVFVQFQAKETREGGTPTQAELGPSIGFRLEPVVLGVGYRYMPSPNEPTQNRLRLDLIFLFPLKAKIVIADRNRVDLDWQSGTFTWRYRNKFAIAKTITIKSYQPRPYVAVEPFYESQFQKWSTTALYAGCLFPIGKHAQFDVYYEHQNNTGNKPNQQLNQFGLALSLYF